MQPKIMLDKFLSYIQKEKLFSDSDHILLAVSGGLDSMVMLKLFQMANFHTGVAHVNHQLRGKESAEDQRFIEVYCAKNKLPFFLKIIEHGELSHGNKQDKARNLRYVFFSEVMLTHKFNFVATAHHRDDSVETFLIHAMRGAGLDGLSSISAKREHIVRPLLFATRKEISQFARLENIEYREDSSNISDKYLRNKIRHNILPAMYEVDDRAQEGIHHTIKNIQSTNDLLAWLLKKMELEYAEITVSSYNIHLNKLNTTAHPVQLLFQYIKKFGYSEVQCIDIINHFDRSGKYFYSSTHCALVNRQILIIQNINQETDSFKDIRLEVPFMLPFKGQIINFDWLHEDETIDFTSNCQYLCLDDFSFPLTIRKWKEGDRFSPFGMKGKTQKVQDYLTNHKLSLFDKKNILLLTSGNEILSVIGYRISDKVRVGVNSSKVLKITTG